MGKKSDAYDAELEQIQLAIVQSQAWSIEHGSRVVIVLEGRDTAGKDGAIKRLTEHMSPRQTRVIALPKPSDRETSQWYFQRYVPHLPAAGEMVLFDRSWYNRAGVETVMGFCSEDEREEFFRTVPEFERMLVRSGITLIKYWFSVSDTEQERRFQSRINDPTRRWKISPMDLESRKHWVEYSQAKDTMFSYTDTKTSPWYVVHSDDKKKARLNCIAHLLSKINYEQIERPALVLPPKEDAKGYVRPPMAEQTFVPDFAAELLAGSNGIPSSAPSAKAKAKQDAVASKEPSKAKKAAAEKKVAAAKEADGEKTKKKVKKADKKSKSELED